MDELIDIINKELEWRQDELSNLKFSISTENKPFKKELLCKYSVIVSYASWEGFVKESLKNYSKFINRNKLFVADLFLISKIIEENDFFKKETKYYKDFANLKELLHNPQLLEELPKISNLNFKRTNKLLGKYNLEKLDDSRKSTLNSLVVKRDSIAHGENQIVSLSDSYKYIDLSIQLMYDLILIIDNKINDFNIG